MSGDDPTGDATEESEADPSDDAPLSDLARRVNRRRSDGDSADAENPTADAENPTADAENPTANLDPDLPTGPPPDPDEDPFERMSVGEIDEEVLWSSLGSDDTPGVGADVESAPDVDTDSLSDVGPVSGVESVGGAESERPEYVVPKEKYCQSCPYLDDPPGLACTHEDTEIVEVVDNERFRVRNCPMIEDGAEPTE